MVINHLLNGMILQVASLKLTASAAPEVVIGLEFPSSFPFLAGKRPNFEGANLLVGFLGSVLYTQVLHRGSTIITEC